MTDPAWVLSQTVFLAQDQSIRTFGGTPGVRDASLVESALAAPQQRWGYEDPKPDLFDLAATYAASLSQNHGFIDGNKRAGHIAAHSFLILNGVKVTAPDPTTAVLQIEALATRQITRDAYATYLRSLTEGD